MKEIIIAVVLVGVGVWLLRWGQRLWNAFTRRAQVGAEPEPPTAEEREVRGPAGVDGLVFLFAHQFVVSPPPTGAASPDRIASAPLTQEAIDGQDWANQLIYAVLAEQYQNGCIEFRVVERIPTLMPPFAQKCWELQVKQQRLLAASPLGECVNTAFEMLHKRQRTKQASGGDEGKPVEGWCCLDELIEWVLKTVRTEISFWQRQGVYQDLRNYVQESLVAANYLIEQPRDTWLERMRPRQFHPNKSAIDPLHDEAEALRQRLRQFREQHGSPQAQQDDDDQPRRIEETVAPDLMSPERPLDELPLEDCLRISIYEALMGLRELEPKRGV